MNEYVSKEYLNGVLDSYIFSSNGAEHYAYGVCQKTIQDAPAADVVDVKHGYWKVVEKQRGNVTDGFWTERYLQCSECNYERRHSWLRGEKPPYCECCGSKMDGENNG